MRTILKIFKETIQEYNLIQKNDKILIAYSGGVDSTGLLFLLLEVREELSLGLNLSHFNHRLRLQAEEDEQFVKEVAKQLSLPLFVGSENVRKYAKKEKQSLEEAGRKLRYDFLKKTAVDIGANKIATGHTMTDQAETLLMRMLRGSGTRGMTGIYPVVEELIIRPLIRIERESIEDYLLKRKIPYRIDESNYDRRFFRNKIRMELIPHIRRHFEPKIIPLLGKMASILQEEEALLDNLGKKKAKNVIIEDKGGVSLDLVTLSSFPLALRRRVVREFIERIKGDLQGISFKDVESVLGLGKGCKIPIKKNLVLEREGDLVFLKTKTPPKVSYEYPWDGKKLLKIEELNLEFKGKRMKSLKPGDMDFDDEKHAFIDRAKLSFPLFVRSRKAGDRYQPLGTPGKKKLKEIMRAKGILPSERENRPVFLSKGKIVWVLGLPVSEEYKISGKTRDIFAIVKS